MGNLRIVKVNEVNQETARTISLLARTTFEETFGQLFTDRNDLTNYLERTFSISKILSSLSKSNNVFYLAYLDDLPVAYAKLKVQSPNLLIPRPYLGQLQKIYVLKSFLSQKIGHKVQAQLIADAILLGVQNLWLSVLNENERAIQFYVKAGFHKVGNHDFSIGKEDFVFTVMCKKLIH